MCMIEKLKIPKHQRYGHNTRVLFEKFKLTKEDERVLKDECGAREKESGVTKNFS